MSKKPRGIFFSLSLLTCPAFFFFFFPGPVSFRTAQMQPSAASFSVIHTPWSAFGLIGRNLHFGVNM